MRDKVLAAIAAYAEGGSIGLHLDALNLKRGDFYSFKRKDPELQQLYMDVQEARADMMVDEAYQIGSDNSLDPRIARVQAEIRLKIAAAFDRNRFGDKATLELSIKPSLSGAIEEAKRRASLPGRDLAQIIDVQAVDITPQITDRTSDKQSAALEKPTDAAPDPFEEP